MATLVIPKVVLVPVVLASLAIVTETWILMLSATATGHPESASSAFTILAATVATLVWPASSATPSH